MARYTRRRVLEIGGAAVGGLVVGSAAASAAGKRYLVSLKGNRSPASAEVQVVHDLSQVGAAVVRGPKRAAKRLGTVAPDVTLERDQPDVNGLTPTGSDAASSAQDEPLYPFQWDKQLQEIPTVHDLVQGEGSRVAVIDSGVDARHPDLDHAVNVDRSRNFTDDPYGAGVPAGGDHGTHVAGIVAASDANEVGVVGSAPEAEVVDCRVFTREGSASFGDILAALVYATEVDSDAANLSLGAYAPREEFAETFGRLYGKLLNRTLTYANREGTLPVIAAGNDSADLQHDKQWISLPAEGAQACSVSATGPVGFRWGEPGLREPYVTPAKYTNYGTNAVTLAAPGGNYDPSAIETDVPWHRDLVLSTVSTPVFDDGQYESAESNYGWKAGTSMAAPQVAGAAALVASAAPDLSANRVESVLRRTANRVEGYDKTYYGAGVVDPLEAVRTVR